ncbi:MAG: DPP IV N-terminal domain-containing protein, partial [Planctomycetes bacterium]|nr:DPP IV N-terminal domain-containing protein [Planctomycetota bacterium]
MLLAAAGLLTSVPGVAQNKRPLTLQDTCYRVSFGAKVELPQWSADGKALQLQGGRWVDARSGDNVTVDQPSAEKRAVTVRGTELLLDGKELTSDGTAKREAHLSPDGARVSFVRGHDLCVLDVADGKVWPVSSDGSEKLLYGYLDWVYQEEVYGRGDFQANWWSPDSRNLAFLRLDEAKVSRFARIDHVPTDGKKPRAALVNQRVEVLSDYYPKAGEPNPTVRLGIAAPAERRVVWVDLAGYDPDVLIVRVAWTPDSRLIFQVQDRIQTWLDLVVADPATGKIEKLFRETSKTWVNILEQPRWLADGKTFLWLSERSGRKHVYR